MFHRLQLHISCMRLKLITSHRSIGLVTLLEIKLLNKTMYHGVIFAIPCTLHHGDWGWGWGFTLKQKLQDLGASLPTDYDFEYKLIIFVILYYSFCCSRFQISMVPQFRKNAATPKLAQISVYLKQRLFNTYGTVAPKSSIRFYSDREIQPCNYNFCKTPPISYFPLLIYKVSFKWQTFYIRICLTLYFKM